MTLSRLAGALPASALPAALPLGLALLLAGCISALAAPDPEAARLARMVRDDAARLGQALADTAAPECMFEQNRNLYAALDEDANRLALRVGQLPGRTALHRAAQALTRTVDSARESHRLASLETLDPAGPCLSSEALELNVAAIARASSAIEAAAAPDRPALSGVAE